MLHDMRCEVSRGTSQIYLIMPAITSPSREFSFALCRPTAFVSSCKHHCISQRLVCLPQRKPGRLAAARSGQRHSASPLCGMLDAPGLTPPRSQLPSSGLLARLGAALHRALAAVFPVLASAELTRRGAITLCMLGLIRIGHYIPVPGLDLARALGSAPGEFGPGSITRALSGSSELPGNMFLLSITPLMSAYFLMAVLQIVPDIRRHFTRLREEGRQGREVVQMYISVAFVASAVLQAATESGRLVPLAVMGGRAMWAFRLQAGVTLMAGAVLCKHAVQSIDEWGLGEGTGTVIGAGIALGYVQLLSLVAARLAASPPHPAALAAAAALCALLVGAVVWVQGIELRLPLTFFSTRRSQARAGHPVLRTLTHDVDSGAALEAQSSFPMRLSPSGTRSLLFANFWVSMLDQPLSVLGLAGALDNPLAFAALVFALEAFSLGDLTPRQMADFLAQSDAGLKGLSPGLETEQFLSLRRRQLKLLNAAFIAGVSLAARGVDTACAALTGASFGCLNILLLVSTVLGAARQVDALSRGAKIESRIAAEFRVLDEVIADEAIAQQAAQQRQQRAA